MSPMVSTEPMTALPSGEQVEISADGQRATIVEVGGELREYEVDGRSVIDRCPADQMCDGAHGAPFIPWPNRLGDGRYVFDGNEYQVPLNEPRRLDAGVPLRTGGQGREGGPARAALTRITYTRPDRFLAMHYANEIWVHNTAEIMATPAPPPRLSRRSLTSRVAPGWNRWSPRRSNRVTSPTRSRSRG